MKGGSTGVGIEVVGGLVVVSGRGEEKVGVVVRELGNRRLRGEFWEVRETGDAREGGARGRERGGDRK